MAVVYRAEDKALRRQVAVKVLYPHLMKKPEFAARFFREARAAAQLDHPHILRVHDVGGDSSGGDAPGYIVMELVKGVSLKDYLDREGPPLAETVAMIGAVLAEALAVAHGAGVIHRDVKPANVMIAEGGRLVLCDFGVARLQDDEAIVTQTGAMLGTPAYMAPEQALGQKVDARTDLFSLGATLYQLATGVLPATGTAAAVISTILKGEVVSPGRRNPKIGRELERVIVKLMAGKREDRYASAEEAKEALAAIPAAAGLGERDAELARYFAGPGAWNETALPKILESCLVRARAAVARREMARALALADRVLAFDPNHAEALAIAKSSAWRSRPGLWTFVVVGTAAAAGAAGVYALRKPAPASAPAPTPAPSPTPAPADAVVAAVAPPPPPPDAPPPPPVDAATRRTKRATPIDAAPVAVATPSPDAAPPPPSPPPAVSPGKIRVRVSPYCHGTFAGRNLAATGDFELDPGVYALECNYNGKKITDRILIRSGKNPDYVKSLLASITITAPISIKLNGKSYPASSTIPTTSGTYKVEVVGGPSAYLSVSRSCTIKVVDDDQVVCD